MNSPRFVFAFRRSLRWLAGLILLCAPLAQRAHAEDPSKPLSQFTSTRTGTILARSKEQDGPDFFTMRCLGYGGYEIYFQGDDSRSWINIKYGKNMADLREATFKLSPGTFPAKANDVVEWRGVMRNKIFTPYALIYRLKGGNDETREIKTRLIVIKLDKNGGSVVGFAEGKNEDKEAKRMADRYSPY